MNPDELTLPIPSPVTTAPAAPTPIVPAAGGLLPIPGDVSQTSSSTSSGFSERVATPGLNRAMGQRRAADSKRSAASDLQVKAAEEAAKGLMLEQQAKNITREKDLALQGIAAKEAKDAFARTQQAENAAAKRIAEQEEQYRQMDNQTFFGESKTWQKLLWGVSLALGGYGSALSRGQNTPLLLLTKTIDDWGDKHERRMAAIAANVAKGKSELGSVAQDYALKEQQLLPLRKAAAYDRVADLSEREAQALAAAGNTKASGEGMKLTADARAEAAKHRQEAAQKEEQAQQFLAPTATGDKRTGSITQTVPPGTLGKAAVLDRKTGQPIGNAPLPAEGQKSREALAQLKPIEGGFDKISKLIEQSGFTDRIPVVGKLTDLQKRIQAEANLLVAPISQILGSGTPQEAEAKRLLETVSVGPWQGREVALANIASAKRMMQEAYDAKAKSLVPGYSGPVKDENPAKAEYRQLIQKAQAAGDKATVEALTKEMNAL